MQFIRRIILLVIFAVLAFVAGNVLYMYFVTPTNFVPANRAPSEQTFSVAQKSAWLLHGQVMYTLMSTAPDYVPLRDIPIQLRQAVIAVEDRKFYEHFGMDIEGIMRATLVNIQNGGVVEGGSTITQQLARTLYLSNDQSIDRKAWEAAYAIALEAQLNKDKLLELYLNTVYFGENAYGVHAAARTYYKKNVRELNLDQSSTLAGIINGPSIFNPIVDAAAAHKRQRIVLDAMLKCGYISQQDVEDVTIKY